MDRNQKSAANVLTALKSIRATPPDGEPVYVFLDHPSAHKGAKIRTWAQRHNVELCFPPGRLRAHGPPLNADVPRVRFHDLRHTHASLLVASGEPIKVVTERLGHAHPGFTMHTYQHLLPGMSAAADRFATLIATAGR